MGFSEFRQEQAYRFLVHERRRHCRFLRVLSLLTHDYSEGGYGI